MVAKVLCVLVLAVAAGNVFGGPAFYLDPEARPLTPISELGSRLAAHVQHEAPDARLPLPTPQDFEAIKKVAQILITLGQQVIPAIIGEPQAAMTSNCESPPVEDVPNDVVNASV